MGIAYSPPSPAWTACIQSLQWSNPLDLAGSDLTVQVAFYDGSSKLRRVQTLMIKAIDGGVYDVASNTLLLATNQAFKDNRTAMETWLTSSLQTLVNNSALLKGIGLQPGLG